LAIPKQPQLPVAGTVASIGYLATKKGSKKTSKKKSTRAQTSLASFDPAINTPASSILEDYPEIAKYKLELCALCSYLKDRETGRYAWLFVQNTVLTNVIKIRPELSANNYKSLVEAMERHGLAAVKKKGSHILTEQGIALYRQIKAHGFIC
jgi:hypothetical protein